ncbi:MAG: hypothetical protein IPL89_17220 [Acidobacteria bacterium]|nr:hypothetical protein [Acidobacteriota bacterium]
MRIDLNPVSRDPDGLPRVLKAFYGSEYFDKPSPQQELGPDKGSPDGHQLRLSVVYRDKGAGRPEPAASAAHREEPPKAPAREAEKAGTRPRSPRRSSRRGRPSSPVARRHAARSAKPAGGPPKNHAAGVWRAPGLFSVLLVLIGVNAALLVSYNGLYESRVRALQETQKNLEERKREVTASIAKLKAREEELGALREKGSRPSTPRRSGRGRSGWPRSSRTSPPHRKAAMRPDEISYAEDDTGRMSMTFLLRGKYIDVKKLMAELETSDSFFVLEGIAVAADDDDPDGPAA